MRLTRFSPFLFAVLAFLAWPAPAAASGPLFTSLYSFGGYPGGATMPQSQLTMGQNGVLYGTSNFGGTYGLGAVFSLAPPASAGGSWTETVLWGFGGAGDGEFPSGGVLIGRAGALYGTTLNGGAYGLGAVYVLVPPASSGGTWTETLVYSFMGSPDGEGPEGSLAIDRNGALYGATLGGGSANWGTVFRLTPPVTAGDPWTETVLHSFMPDVDGLHPVAGVVISSGGVLYGATSSGGSAGDGTVFSVAPPVFPGGPWNETVLHSFTGSPNDGNGPACSME